MVQAVIFDLGNTLISYYTSEEFPGILEEAINNCAEQLKKDGTLKVSNEKIRERVKEHNHGSPGNKVYPMENRLGSIFQIEEEEKRYELCTSFMRSIFKTSKLYDDVIPVLKELKRRDYKTAILTNTPWG
ncbi:MAG: HAD hydrolase-like protein, partial [Candidatus Bathyarchaeota archaeon]|nr:HAD hydrolase-like protein [Candidatus Bathyarchaeota archaeon]